VANGIGWDENVPSDTESLGLGDDRIRSLKTSLRQGLDDEHNFPSSGGDNVGYHKYGSARPYFGTQSRVSSSGTNSRLMLTSDTSRLFGVGSGGTVLVGGSTVISIGTDSATAGGRHYWVEEVGTSATGASTGSVIITFPNSGFSGTPYTFCSAYSNSDDGRNVTLTINPISGAQIAVSAQFAHTATYAGNTQFFWRSVGTRVF
jgi:hypothetical protein